MRGGQARESAAGVVAGARWQVSGDNKRRRLRKPRGEQIEGSGSTSDATGVALFQDAVALIPTGDVG
jgi:hypothetical protein